MTLTKPLTPEEEYFAREELAKMRRLGEEKQRNLAQEEKEQLKKLHWMRCPKCGQELQEVVFRGLSIDKCFSCEGVYLDKGELDKLGGSESGFLSSVFGLFRI